METGLLIVAGIAVGLAVVIFIVNKMNTPKSQMGVPYVSPLQKPPPMPDKRQSNAKWLKGRIPSPPPIKRQCNMRGWRAPSNHYFNGEGQLFTDAGDLIIDMYIIAQLCGEQYDGIEETPAVIDGGVESISSETSHSVSAEVSNTEDTTRHSSPAESYGGDSHDSGGCDSGGDSGGGGGCDCD